MHLTITSIWFLACSRLQLATVGQQSTDYLCSSYSTILCGKSQWYLLGASDRLLSKLCWCVAAGNHQLRLSYSHVTQVCHGHKHWLHSVYSETCGHSMVARQRHIILWVASDIANCSEYWRGIVAYQVVQQHYCWAVHVSSILHQADRVRALLPGIQGRYGTLPYQVRSRWISWDLQWDSYHNFPLYLPNDAVIYNKGTIHQIGRAHVWTPVTSAHLVCRLLLEKKKQQQQ